MTKIQEFIDKYQFSANEIDMQEVVMQFLQEMECGLVENNSSLRMLETYIEVDNEYVCEEAVLAIDAGGTNFRKALIKADSNGKLVIKGVKNYKMPAIEREISKNEFFETIAEYIRNYAEDVKKVGFCFSYPTEIHPNKDGKLLQFSKEVQAPEVVGEWIGKNLLRTLGMEDKKVTLLNDTVATLLAGKSAITEKCYDSYIGYILGTGTNTCYVERNCNIKKNPKLDITKSQIINIESGNFSKIKRSGIDIIFDLQTNNPGNYVFEKMFSGGYFGGLCLTCLQTAAKEGLFCEATANNILEINDLTTIDITNFIERNRLSGNLLYEAITRESDQNICDTILCKLIERSAKLVAANLAAVILKTGKGLHEDSPILITIEGTTYYKLPCLKVQVERYLHNYLNDNNIRYFETIQVEMSSLVGAALAALVN